MIKTKYITLVLWSVLFGFTGCSDDDDSIQPFTISFSSTDTGISTESPKTEIVINFSRPSTISGMIEVNLNSNGLTYGESNDFYTSIPPEDNRLLLEFTSGDERVSFDVFAGSAAAITEDKTVSFTLLEDKGSTYVIGDQSEVNVLFAENFISQGASGAVNVSSEFTQRAYIDLSKASTMTMAYDNYDLGFHTGSGFYVSLNATAAIMARPLEGVTDLNTVTANDTLGFAAQMMLPPPRFQPNGSIAWIDTPDGNLETTAFGEISSSADANPVYIIKRNGTWKKVRVLRAGAGYTLHYADINATTFQTLEIAKDAMYEEVTVNLDTGIVEATPENDRWDLLYGKYTEQLNLGAPGLDIPYEFKDYITTNRSDVQVAMVMTDSKSYEAFSTADIADLEFRTEINAIGSSWRAGGGPSSAPAVYTDRFYVIRDGDSNVYKVRFTDMYTSGGERGELSYTYELLD